MKFIQFGKIIPNLTLYDKPANYPVLNERDARAAAGVMLIAAIFAFTQALLLRDFFYINIAVILFTIEFFIRVVINPQYAPFYALGTLIVKKQAPEYTGAAQKKFAWYLGLAMAGSMVFIVNLFQTRGIAPFTICIICMFLLWSESAFGICFGCKMYKGFMALGWIKKPMEMPVCPGNVCSVDKKVKDPE